MKLRYASIVDNPETGESTVYVVGCPLKCPWCFSGPLVNETDACAEESVEEILGHFKAHGNTIHRVIFTGAEPLAQANALLHILKELREEGFETAIETSGFYPEALNDLLPHLTKVSLDVKTRPDPAAYKKITGFKGDGELALSHVLKSLVFLEKWEGYREIRTTILEDVNDSEDDIDAIAQLVPWCEQYTLQQYQQTATPVGPITSVSTDPADPDQKTVSLPLSETNPRGVGILRMIELARKARQRVRNVRIRTETGEFSGPVDFVKAYLTPAVPLLKQTVETPARPEPAAPAMPTENAQVDKDQQEEKESDQHDTQTPGEGEKAGEAKTQPEPAVQGEEEKEEDEALE